MPASSLVDLVLLRHGIAEDRIGGRDHPERALTVVGRQRTQAVVETLVARGLQLDRLITSPYRRALETAELALQAGLAPVLDTDDRLCPDASPEELMAELRGRVGLVGHEPDLSTLACDLLGMAHGSLLLRKAGLVQLRQALSGWELRGLFRPGLLLDS